MTGDHRFEAIRLIGQAQGIVVVPDFLTRRMVVGKPLVITLSPVPAWSGSSGVVYCPAGLGLGLGLGLARRLPMEEADPLRGTPGESEGGGVAGQN
jgi:hypothetical protein